MQNVIEKILEEAKKEAEAITERYEKEISRLKREYEEKILEAEKKLNEEIEKKKKEEVMKAIAQARLEYNKKLAGEMQEYIDDVLNSAIKKLPEHKKYFNFLKDLIKNSDVKEGELYLSSADKQKYQSQIEKFIKQEGYNFIIKNDDKMSGGVIIKKGKVTFLGSIDVIAEIMKEELKIMIARSLGFV
ncbi:MAG: V-type ATP synthase subunit E [candidate division WOR-3 bacterium]